MEPRPSEPVALALPPEEDAPAGREAAFPRLLPRRVVALLKAEDRPETPPPAVDVTCPVLLTLLDELDAQRRISDSVQAALRHERRMKWLWAWRSAVAGAGVGAVAVLVFR